MTENLPNHNWTRYIKAILIVTDLIVVNLIFVATALIFNCYLFSPLMRTAWLLFNVAYLPTVLVLTRDKHSNRAILMDHVLARSVQTVLFHALLFIAMSGFIHLDFSMSFYLVAYAMMIVVIPVTWIISRFWVNAAPPRQKSDQGYHRRYIGHGNKISR